jgi:RimJ/RimL family protein N-acetyltransferase
MTTYMNVDAANRRVEIGSTWNARSAQRTGTNAESKLLLLGHAFDTLDCIAVEFRTHWHNRQSRAAIEGLGAKQDGVLRSHQRMANGSLRDTVVYSVIAPEWPAVRAELQRRLAAHGRSEI